MTKNSKSGQVAIMLILILVILTTITTAIVAIAFSTTRDTTAMTIGEEAIVIANSAAENALLRILRDSNYAGDTNLPIGDGSATIVVSTNGTSKTVVAKGVVGSMVRTIQVQTSLIGGKLTVNSWQEI